MRATPLPDLILYERDGCHLCDQTRELVTALLARRAATGLAVPSLVRRDIDTDPGWQRAFFETIPVLELGGRRLELAIGLAKVGAFLDAELPAAGWGRALVDLTTEAP